MRTRITADNPYGYDRYGFAWQKVPEDGAAHLDFGCASGAFLASLRSKGIARLVGVDIAEDAVAQARRQFADLEIIHIKETVPLPFEDGIFTSITVLDVIEHIYEQRAVLCELKRVLTDDGTLIVTVPRQHLFSFLDLGNLKFRFPGIHRWYYCRKHSRDEYERRYQANPDGLVGDISAKKRWHEHFSRRKLRTLLNSAGFEVVCFDGTGFFLRIIRNLKRLFNCLRPLQSLLGIVEALDAKWFSSANLFCVARKKQ
jgi:SAM-dependent methyltransferase